jgi:uncharacterized protein involved in exopolysaccharide biosynthesis
MLFPVSYTYRFNKIDQDNAAILAAIKALQAAVTKELATMSDTFATELAALQAAQAALATAVTDNTAAIKKLTDELAAALASGTPDLAAMGTAVQAINDQATALEAAAQAVLNPPAPTAP